MYSIGCSSSDAPLQLLPCDNIYETVQLADYLWWGKMEKHKTIDEDGYFSLPVTVPGT